MLLLFGVWSVVVVLINCSDDCSPTSAEDVLVAALHSDYVYGDHGTISVGDTVVGATDFIVQKVVKTDFTWFHLQPLRVIVTKKSCTFSWQCTPTVVISFMGTVSTSQLLNEMWSYGTHSTSIMGQPVQVMEYFWKALEILDIVENMEVEGSSTRYIITGHSLGGAFASVFAAQMAEKGDGLMWSNPESRLITFGEPRVGDRLYAAWHDMLIPPHQKLRIVHNGDLVPHVPPKLKGYRHESREIWMEETSEREWYWGYCSVVLPWCYTYRYLTKWHVCSNGEAKECSGTVFDHSILDHLMGHYLEKINILNQYPEKKKKFLDDQCSTKKS